MTKNKMIWITALAASCVATTSAQGATKHDQAVIDKAVAAYQAPVQRVLDVDKNGKSIEKLVRIKATCDILRHTVFVCDFTVKTVKHGKGHSYKFPMVGTVKRGAHRTHIDLYLNGPVAFDSKSHAEWELAG